MADASGPAMGMGAITEDNLRIEVDLEEPDSKAVHKERKAFVYFCLAYLYIYMCQTKIGKCFIFVFIS